MTNYELERLAALLADGLVERMKADRELLDKVYPAKYFDVAETAKYLHIPPSSLRHMTKEIPHSVIGRRLLFNERDLIEYIANKKVK